MEQQRRDIQLTRSDLAQISGIFGVAALLTGALTWVWLGQAANLVIVALIAGAAGITGWIAIAPRDFANFIAGRQARQGTIAALSTLIFIGIILLIYIVIERAVITYDMTERQAFTLSAETQRVLENLNREIRITGFYSSSLLPSRELDDQFFRQYEVASNGLITRQYINPVQEPTLAQTFGAQDGDIFISYVDPATGQIDWDSVYYVPMIGRQERDMTQAIARLLVSGNFVAYYDVGFGELSPTEPSSRGISIATELLLVNGFQTRGLNLLDLALSGRSIPDDATVLMLARPTEQFPPAVIQLIDNYLAQGGTLFILADALFTAAPFLAESDPFNQYLWDNWGIRMLDAVVVDRAASGPTPLDVVSAVIYDSPISAGIDPESDLDSRTQFRVARAIEVSQTPPVNNGSVILSSPDGYSYGERDLTRLAQTGEYEYDEGIDLPGPLTTVAYAFRSADDDRVNGAILLVGDSDFITDGQIGSPAGNAYLFVDGISWLTGFDEQVGFTPVAMGVAQPFIFVSTQQLDQIAFITMILLPGMTLLTGAVIWYWRGRR